MKWIFSLQRFRLPVLLTLLSALLLLDYFPAVSKEHAFVLYLLVGWSHPRLDRFLTRFFSRPLVSPGTQYGGQGLLAIVSLLLLGQMGFFLVEKGFISGMLHGAMILGALLIWKLFDSSGRGLLLALLTSILAGLFASLLCQWDSYWMLWYFFAASVCVGNVGRLLARSN